jgi:hypothetical protein
MCNSQDFEALLTDHGGEGESGDLLVIQASFLRPALVVRGRKGAGHLSTIRRQDLG